MHEFDDQYPKWMESTFGTPPVCIPEASDVCSVHVGTRRTADANATDYDVLLAKLKEGDLHGFRGEKQVHRAFQRSNVGGILIQKIEKNELFGKLKRLLSQDAREEFGNVNSKSLSN
jgi:hypothetical protein